MSVPCVSCKTRRTWCDATKPCCVRCSRDGISCPGYIRIREWNSTANPLKCPAPTLPDSKEDMECHELVLSKSRMVTEEPREPIASHVNASSIPLNQDRETLLLFHCLQHFEQALVPSSTPRQLPFRRQDAQIAPDLIVGSRLFELMLINATRTALCAQSNNSEYIVGADYWQCRALCVAELRPFLSDAGSEPYGIALIGTIMFLLLDLYTPSTDTWEYHLEAARNILRMRGGFLRCVEASHPSGRTLLFNYMGTDIFSATTCNPRLLTSGRMSTQWEYLNMMADEQAVEGLFSAGFAYPPIIQDIICTTFLRAARRKNAEFGQRIPRNFTAILRSIEDFRPIVWAKRVALYGNIHPQKLTDCASVDFIASWATLATCYKSAALLYLLLSCSDLPRAETEMKIRSAKYTLSTHIGNLMDIARVDFDGPVETQLWKHVSWPVLISAYVRIGWGIGSESIEVEVNRLRGIAAATNRKAGFGSPTFLHEILTRERNDVELAELWNDTMK